MTSTAYSERRKGLGVGSLGAAGVVPVGSPGNQILRYAVVPATALEEHNEYGCGGARQG